MKPLFILVSKDQVLLWYNSHTILSELNVSKMHSLLLSICYEDCGFWQSQTWWWHWQWIWYTQKTIDIPNHLCLIIIMVFMVLCWGVVKTTHLEERFSTQCKHCEVFWMFATFGWQQSSCTHYNICDVVESNNILYCLFLFSNLDVKLNSYFTVFIKVMTAIYTVVTTLNLYSDHFEFVQWLSVHHTCHIHLFDNHGVIKYSFPPLKPHSFPFSHLPWFWPQ